MITFLVLIAVGLGLGWVFHNPKKTADWLISFAKKKDENNVDQA